MQTRQSLKGVIAISYVCLLALSTFGCATTKDTNRETVATGGIPRPAHIWVYDFASTPAEIPPGSALASLASAPAETQTAAQLAEGKKLGAELATQLVAQIQLLNMPAVHAASDSNPQVNDLVIHGYILSIQQGDAKERVGLGLGKGESELKTAVEGFQVTPSGLRKLGGGDLDAAGSKTPGAAVGVVGMLAMHNPLGLIVSTVGKEHAEKTGSATIEGRVKQTATEIADALKQRFQEQGWIK